MKFWIGLGSNLGDRKANLERAALALRAGSASRRIKASPIYENPAMTPPGAPAEWLIPFLNAVAEVDWNESPAELLRFLKSIERDMGRAVGSEAGPRWSPRAIDLDILAGQEGSEPLLFASGDVRVPHPELARRAFALDPLKDVAPSLRVGPKGETALSLARAHPRHAPLWMGIINLTPDSFSDGGQVRAEPEIEARARAFEEVGVHILDVGGESTRPGASPITASEEWARISPAIEVLKVMRATAIFRPLISVDTRRAEVAKKALQAGVDWINDVSGLGDPEMAEVVRGSGCGYVLMHSLSAPVDRSLTLPADVDPVQATIEWAQLKLARLAEKGVDLNRISFDPGIGFGKTAAQSLAISRRAREYGVLPVRLLFGHSRKSYMKLWTESAPADLDLEGVGVSLHLASQGADILRVHSPQLHVRAHRAFQENSPWNE